MEIKKIAVVTDNSFVSDELYKKYKNLKCIELSIILPEEINNMDYNKLTNDEFSELVNKYDIKTSQPSIGVIEEKWDSYLKEYDFLIIAGLSKKMSGAYSSQYSLSKMDKFKDKVLLTDTLAMSSILEKIVLNILELIEVKKFNTKDEISIEVNKIVKNINSNYLCLIFPRSLEVLKRGGRVSNLSYKITNILKINPILEFKNGIINKYGIIKNYFKGILKQLNQLKNDIDEEYIEIAYSKFDDEDFIPMIKKELSSIYKITKDVSIPKIILSHWGKNFLVINLWKKNKK